MNWQQTTINLGIVKESSKNNLTFVSTKKLEIDKVVPSCGTCTFVRKYNEKTQKLEVVYVPGKIPPQLRKSDSIPIRKTITVTYKDGEQEVLSFTATLQKR